MRYFGIGDKHFKQKECIIRLALCHVLHFRLFIKYNYIESKNRSLSILLRYFDEILFYIDNIN